MIEIVNMNIWEQGLKTNYSKALNPAIVDIMFWKIEGQVSDKNWNHYGKICSSII